MTRFLRITALGFVTLGGMLLGFVRMIRSFNDIASLDAFEMAVQDEAESWNRA